MHQNRSSSKRTGGDLSRRQFLSSAAAAGAGMALGLGHKPARAQSLAGLSQINVALVGLGGRGSGFLVNQASSAASVDIVALCDPDDGRVNTVWSGLGSPAGVARTRDYRTLLTDPNIHAFMLASNTHWHGLQTIDAILAGKDVYCEKPPAHNIYESRLMLQAANAHSKIVQIGTHRRSANGAQQAKAYLEDPTLGTAGALGPIQWIHCHWFSNRSPGVGLQSPWTPSFSALDFDLYMGPRNIVPLTRGTAPLTESDVHNGWHYSWDTGNGDLSNLGVHVFDQARFIASIVGAPTRVRSIGNRYVFNDAGTTPNIQLTLMDYPGFPVVVENRGLPFDITGTTAGTAPDGVHFGFLYPTSLGGTNLRTQGIRIQCLNGFILAFEGAGVYDNSNTLISSAFSAGSAETSHASNFFDAVRSRDAASLRSPLSAVNPTNDGCLVGNVSYRMGVPTSTSAITTAIAGFGSAPDRFTAIQTHLSSNSVNLTSNPLIMGPWLTYDESSGSITEVDGSTNPTLVNQANALLTDTYRAPYELPDTVPVELSNFSVS